MELTLSELARRFENLIRVGTITHIQHSTTPRVRVKLGELNTGWLQLATLRAGSTKTWNPPTVGEDVLVIAPSGDLEAAIAVLSINSQQNPAPSNDPNITRTLYKDGAQLDYNHALHRYRFTLPDAGNYTVKVGASTLNLCSAESTLKTGQSHLTLIDTQADLKGGSSTYKMNAAGASFTTPVVKSSANLSVGTGASGSFTTPTGQIVTVMDGIIINIF